MAAIAISASLATRQPYRAPVLSTIETPLQTLQRWTTLCDPTHPQSLATTEVAAAVLPTFAAALRIFSTHAYYREASKSLIHEPGAGYARLQKMLFATHLVIDPVLSALLYFGWIAVVFAPGSYKGRAVSFSALAKTLRLATHHRGWCFPDTVIALALYIWRQCETAARQLDLSPRTIRRRLHIANSAYTSPLRSPKLRQLVGLDPAPTSGASRFDRRFPLGWGDSQDFDVLSDEWVPVKASPDLVFFCDEDILRVELHPDNFQCTAQTDQRTVRYGRTADGRYVGQQMSWGGCAGACLFMTLADRQQQILPRWMLHTTGMFLDRLAGTLRGYGLSTAMRHPLPPPEFAQQYLANALLYGPLILHLSGHFIILDRFSWEHSEPTAHIRDPYHGWAIVIRRGALAKYCLHEYIDFRGVAS